MSTLSPVEINQSSTLNYLGRAAFEALAGRKLPEDAGAYLQSIEDPLFALLNVTDWDDATATLNALGEIHDTSEIRFLLGMNLVGTQSILADAYRPCAPRGGDYQGFWVVRRFTYRKGEEKRCLFNVTGVSAVRIAHSQAEAEAILVTWGVTNIDHVIFTSYMHQYSLLGQPAAA